MEVYFFTKNYEPIIEINILIWLLFTKFYKILIYLTYLTKQNKYVIPICYNILQPTILICLVIIFPN